MSSQGRFPGETMHFQGQVLDETGRPVVPSPDDMTVEVLSLDGLPVNLEDDMTLMSEEAGVVSAATGGTVTDSSQAWATDEWRDFVFRTAGGQERRILHNTATTLTLDLNALVNGSPVGALSPVPVALEAFTIHRSRYRYPWDIPLAQADTDLEAVFRATTGTVVDGQRLRLRIEKAL